jgi:hypothetical protein
MNTVAAPQSTELSSQVVESHWQVIDLINNFTIDKVDHAGDLNTVNSSST